MGSARNPASPGNQPPRHSLPEVEPHPGQVLADRPELGGERLVAGQPAGPGRAGPAAGLAQRLGAGALPTLYAATDATPGSYTGPQSLRESRGKPGPARASRLARDETLAAQLWSVSEDLTGVRFDFGD